MSEEYEVPPIGKHVEIYGDMHPGWVTLRRTDPAFLTACQPEYLYLYWPQFLANLEIQRVRVVDRQATPAELERRVGELLAALKPFVDYAAILRHSEIPDAGPIMYSPQVPGIWDTPLAKHFYDAERAYRGAPVPE